MQWLTPHRMQGQAELHQGDVTTDESDDETTHYEVRRREILDTARQVRPCAIAPGQMRGSMLQSLHYLGHLSTQMLRDAPMKL